MMRRATESVPIRVPLRTRLRALAVAFVDHRIAVRAAVVVHVRTRALVRTDPSDRALDRVPEAARAAVGFALDLRGARLALGAELVDR
jgi:hypothetical protein